MTMLNARRSRRIVLAVGAAAALAGVTSGVAGATTPDQSPSRTQPTPSTSGAPVNVFSEITKVRGNVHAWLANADDTKIPLLCAGPANEPDPWCGVLNEEPVLVVQQTFDDVIVGIVPATATKVWVGRPDGDRVQAKLGAAWRGMRVFGVDADAVPEQPADGREGITVYASGANGRRLLERTAVDVASLQALAPTDDAGGVTPLYQAAGDDDEAHTVDGLGVWRAQNHTCVGRLGEMTSDGRFVPGEEADPEAVLRWWPQYCSDPVTEVSSAWFLNWVGPQAGTSKYALLMLPGATKRANLANSAALRLLGAGQDKLALVDVGHGSAKLNVRTGKATVYSGPISKLIGDALPGVSPLRVAD